MSQRVGFCIWWFANRLRHGIPPLPNVCGRNARDRTVNWVDETSAAVTNLFAKPATRPCTQDIENGGLNDF